MRAAPEGPTGLAEGATNASSIFLKHIMQTLVQAVPVRSNCERTFPNAHSASLGSDGLAADHSPIQAFSLVSLW
jgi:hypothetical protein